MKLFHCVRDPVLNSPYALRVVSRDAIQGMYYTFSASGVVQVFADDSAPEFTPIGEWMREQAVFSMMMQLSFFRNARAAKSFALWRCNSRARRIASVKRRLEGALLLAKPNFCSAVMEIQSQVFQLTRTPLVELGDKACALHSFSAEQAEVLRSVLVLQQLTRGLREVLPGVPGIHLACFEALILGAHSLLHPS